MLSRPTMKNLLLVILGMLLLVDTYGQGPINNKTVNIIYTCDDLPDSGLRVKGELIIAGDINCEGSLKFIEVTGDTTVRTTAREMDMRTRNVMWTVNSGVSVTYAASTVRLERDERMAFMGLWIMHVQGAVDFQVDGWHKSHDEGDLEDKHGLVHSSSDGTVCSEQSLRFSKNGILVADPENYPNATATGSGASFVSHSDGDNKEATLTRSSEPFELIRRKQREVARGSSGSQATATGSGASFVSHSDGDNKEATLTRSSEPFELIRRKQREVARGSSGSGDGGMPSGRFCGTISLTEVREANKTAARIDGGAGPDEPSVQPGGDMRRLRVRSRPPIVLSTILESAGKTTTSSGSHSASPEERKPRLRIGKLPMIDLDPLREFMRKTNTSSSDDEATGGPESAAPKYLRAQRIRKEDLHPSPSLKVGSSVKGSLFRFGDGVASAYIGVSENGDVTHRKLLGNAPVDAQGRRTGPTPKETTVLVPADPRKMQRVLENRQILGEMKENEERVASGISSSEKKNMEASVMAWVPFWNGGCLRRRELEHARAHLGKTELRVTSRGKVEASVDGTVVSRVSGPSWLAHLRRDDSHEFRTTDDGFEVTRRGEYVWGIKV